MLFLVLSRDLTPRYQEGDAHSAKLSPRQKPMLTARSFFKLLEYQWWLISEISAQSQKRIKITTVLYTVSTFFGDLCRRTGSHEYT